MAVKFDNYVVTLGFMVAPINEGGLGLKGNEATVFAMIYGFSQNGTSWYEGTQRYIAEWCGASVRGIQKNLDSLIAKEYIEKKSVDINGVTLVRYRVTDKVLQSSYPTNKVRTPHEQSSHNNTIHNIPPYEDSKESSYSPKRGAVEEIVAYLNAKTEKHFLPTAKATQRKINARLKEGRTVEDFKQVIDTKTAEWQGTQWDKFLSPDTLFGEKFERYLNQTATEEEDAWGYPIYD